MSTPATKPSEQRPSGADLPRAALPPVGLGLASAVLGGIGLLLFILPVLGIPISMLGLLLGLGGCAAGLFSRRVSLRLSIAGVILSGLALIADTAITWAPAGYLPNSHVQQAIEPVPGRPYVSPPANIEP